LYAAPPEIRAFADGAGSPRRYEGAMLTIWSFGAAVAALAVVVTVRRRRRR